MASNGSAKRRMVKKMKRSAVHRMEDALASGHLEEARAWETIIRWFDAILSKSYVNRWGAIAISGEVPP